jgi:lysylphosphatidylglycerol synthetase-like protein (DUF2156 family)
MILPGTRLLLVIFSGLTLLAFVVLFVLADETERDFAWTIKPPATAAFLGAAYAAGCALVVLALRKGTWAALRIPFLTILVFAVATLIATLLHLDRLHFGSDILAARYAAYFWMGVYLLVPRPWSRCWSSRNAGRPQLRRRCRCGPDWRSRFSFRASCCSQWVRPCSVCRRWRPRSGPGS